MTSHWIPTLCKWLQAPLVLNWLLNVSMHGAWPETGSWPALAPQHIIPCTWLQTALDLHSFLNILYYQCLASDPRTGPWFALVRQNIDAFRITPTALDLDSFLNILILGAWAKKGLDLHWLLNRSVPCTWHPNSVWHAFVLHLINA